MEIDFLVSRMTELSLSVLISLLRTHTHTYGITLSFLLSLTLFLPHTLTRSLVSLYGAFVNPGAVKSIASAQYPLLAQLHTTWRGGPLRPCASTFALQLEVLPKRLHTTRSAPLSFPSIRGTLAQPPKKSYFVPWEKCLFCSFVPSNSQKQKYSIVS